MLSREDPNTVNKHEAAGVNATPGELARKVFDIAARTSVRSERHLSPQTEPGVRLQPALLLLAARMSGALDPATGQCVEARGIDINQGRLGYQWMPDFAGIYRLVQVRSRPDIQPIEKSYNKRRKKRLPREYT